MNGWNEKKYYNYKINDNILTKYNNFNDYIRLNDSTLIKCYKDSLSIIKNYSIRLDSLKVPQICEFVIDTVFPDFKFNSLLKINDTCFVVAGSYKNFPAYVLFNQKSEILDSGVINNKIGEFKFVSLTPDSNLLLSGFKYKSFQYEVPYFVKTKDTLISNLIKSQEVSDIKETKENIFISCQPNPTNSLTTINFNLIEDKEVSLKLFDIYGNLVYNIQNQEFNSGLNSIDVDFSNFSSGIFFYNLIIDRKNYSGKIIYFK